MAPSATETVTVTQPPLKLHSTTSGTGDYKQLQAHNVDRDAEEGRKAGIKGAKVRGSHQMQPPSSLFMKCLFHRFEWPSTVPGKRGRRARSVSYQPADHVSSIVSSMPTTFPPGTLANGTLP